MREEPAIFDTLRQRFGGQLQSMTYEQKIVMRAALAGYIAEKPVWQENNDSTCIDVCIEGAGIGWDIWDKDEELVEYIRACSQLSEADIEGLIEALTSQLRSKVYASRIEEWVVVSP